MSYSPFVGPALLVLFVVSSLPTAYRHARARTPPVGKRAFWAIGLASVLLAAGQAALNLWVSWLGDGVFAAAVGMFLFLTRK
jgi:uncharacterized BrkB/YihY/UPF0761 family membrane protein